MRTRSIKLWFARILRLTGIALAAGWFISLGIAEFWGQSGMQSSTIPLSWVEIVIFGIACTLLGIPLALIGEKISPPDPWLDPWLNPFRGHKRNLLNSKEDAEN
jgi:hypothetical protein